MLDIVSLRISSTGYSILLVLFGTLLILIPSLVGYLIYQSETNKNSSSNESTINQNNSNQNITDEEFKEMDKELRSISNTEMESFPTSPPISSKEFQKRQFDPAKKFFGQDYPDEMIKLSTEELVPMRCSGSYQPAIDQKNNSIESSYIYLLTEETKQYLLSDKLLLDFLENLKKKEGIGSVGVIQYCEIEDGRIIFEYSYGVGPGGGGGMNTVAFFKIREKDGSLRKITSIKNSLQAPYFDCYDPMQLTSSGFLYFQCGGGDGGNGAYAIYQINLNNNTNTQILKTN